METTAWKMFFVVFYFFILTAGHCWNQYRRGIEVDETEDKGSPFRKVTQACRS
jgi:hypothetical protein